MTHEVKDRVQRKLDQFDSISSPEEAQAQLVVLPLTTIHEARYAYQQLRDKFEGDTQLIDILEPFSRAIGWVEALSYSVGIKSQTEGMRGILKDALNASREEVER